MAGKRKKDARSIAILFFAVLVLFLLLCAGFCGYKAYEAHRAEQARAAAESLAASREAMRQTAEGGVGRANGGLELWSPYVLLYSVDEDRVLIARGADTPCAPASLTKMMTVYTALQYLHDPDETVTITYDDLAGLWEANASVAGLSAGDTVTVRDLLYAVMLPSGADAANALARAACGSVPDFVAAMNDTAQSLGMADTHWENVTGLDADGHETTCRDLLRLMKAAMGSDTFREVFCTFSYTTSPTALYPDGIALESTITKKCREMGIEPSPIVGGKTGYTDNAGLCLASVAVVGRHTYYCITMGAEGGSHTPQTNILDQLKLYGRCG